MELNFNQLKEAVQQQFKKMCGGDTHLFKVNIGKDVLWDLYLASFPEGTDPIYRERTEHDCQCCKQFIRNYGGVVTLIDNQLVSIWDVEVGGAYQVVADALASKIRDCKVENVFKNTFIKLGTDKNYQEVEGDVLTWEHFSLKLPENFKVQSEVVLNSSASEARSNKEVLERGLKELTVDACKTVLELICQNSLYRGEEHRDAVERFLGTKKVYDKLPAEQKDNFCWDISARIGARSKIRNTSIGTLLTDLSDGKDLDSAVTAFEKIVAPENYKRPNALITKKMVEGAQYKLTELGYLESLGRRHAVVDDIAVNNVIFADRSVKGLLTGDVFEELKESVAVDPKKLSKVEEVGIEEFVTNIVPKATSLELLFENQHCGNLVSLIAPEKASPSMFKWNNGFSWTYTGELADSTKAKVKAAGGNVEGVLRCSLAWFNGDDLDIHVIEPNRNRIYYSNMRSISSGILDVDMNAAGPMTRTPVENIIWTNLNRMKEGKYKLVINQYAKRESVDFGFEAEIECMGELFSFSYSKPMRNKSNVTVAEFEFNKSTGVKLIKSLDSSSVAKDVWGISTSQFRRVSLMMYSPNHWDDQGVGNRHYFFVLEGCNNPEPVRGFFNEFLKEDLMKHKRVFEALGSKMLAQPSANQLSGLGFSSTQRNSVLCKVEGAFSRVIRIKF